MATRWTDAAMDLSPHPVAPDIVEHGVFASSCRCLQHARRTGPKTTPAAGRESRGRCRSQRRTCHPARAPYMLVRHIARSKSPRDTRLSSGDVLRVKNRVT